eukprot:1886821-Amphidinium_carterae.1
MEQMPTDLKTCANAASHTAERSDENEDPQNTQFYTSLLTRLQSESFHMAMAAVLHGKAYADGCEVQTFWMPSCVRRSGCRRAKPPATPMLRK